MKTRPKLRLFRYLLPVVIVLALIFSVRYCGKQEKPLGHPRDYAAIAKEGILHVATEYNSISFYVDSDTVSGFHSLFFHGRAVSCLKSHRIFPYYG